MMTIIMMMMMMMMMTMCNDTGHDYRHSCHVERIELRNENERNPQNRHKTDVHK